MKLIFKISIAFICISIFGCSGSGAITGFVCDSNSGQIISTTNVLLVGHNDVWNGATTGNTGQFLFPKIPNGIYTLRASRVGFHNGTITDVRVGSDSVSIVAFKLSPNAIPENSFPYPWESSDSTIFPIEPFIRTGKIFNLKCF